MKKGKYLLIITTLLSLCGCGITSSSNDTPSNNSSVSVTNQDSNVISQSTTSNTTNNTTNNTTSVVTSTSNVAMGDVSVSINDTTKASYYSSIDFSKTGATLKTSLYKLISSNFKSVSYDGLWNAFKTTDKRADGKVWDMYSNATNFTFGSKQCGNYSSEGDCYNREHSVPKSWFNEAKPAYSDLFHLYPTDGYVNNRRSNYPFGEVGSATYTSKSGFKLGSCSYPGYTGTVFEPIDEYKGDFARTYFYFATRYEELACNKGEGAVTFTANSYPKLTDYAIDLFLKWDQMDPISQKEIDRNNAVYSYQKNRNPFIDYPSLARRIWSA